VRQNVREAKEAEPQHDAESAARRPEMFLESTPAECRCAIMAEYINPLSAMIET